VIYLYAITDTPGAPLPTAPGIAGATVRTLVHGDIAAVIGAVSKSRVDPSAENLWCHETVLESLMAERTVLPVRFGTVLIDEAALRDLLAAHNAAFVADLDRLRGRVELALRVLWDETGPSLPDPGPPPEHGRAYMLARVAREREERAYQERATATAMSIHAPLAALAVANTMRVLVTPAMPLTAAYLLERTALPAFTAELEARNAAHPGLRCLCTGPWPAYSFVTAVIE
jgi:hypothetical protein